MFCHKVCTSGLRNAFLGRIWKERPIASEARYKEDREEGKEEGRGEGRRRRRKGERKWWKAGRKACI